MDITRNRTKQSVYPALRYRDAEPALEWLKSVLGFEEVEVCRSDDGSVAHAELRFNDDIVMFGSAKDDGLMRTPRDLGGVTSTIYIGLDDAAAVEALFARVKTAGAEIVRALQDTDYGSREFGIRDAEGYGWSFGTYRP